jgi:hypothetical protein
MTSGREQEQASLALVDGRIKYETRKLLAMVIEQSGPHIEDLRR